MTDPSISGTELPLDLAEKELERLKSMIRQP